MEAGAKQYEIAVIVTVFNKEKFLKDTLESILTQKTSRPFCIILSDDGSSDSSRQICADYAAKYHPASNDDYVCVFDITDEEHRGVNGNFLHCLKFAIGLNVKYISQIDSDDILADPAFLERQVSFLESHPDAQAAASGFFLISEEIFFEVKHDVHCGLVTHGLYYVRYVPSTLSFLRVYYKWLSGWLRE